MVCYIFTGGSSFHRQFSTIILCVVLVLFLTLINSDTVAATASQDRQLQSRIIVLMFLGISFYAHIAWAINKGPVF